MTAELGLLTLAEIDPIRARDVGLEEVARALEIGDLGAEVNARRVVGVAERLLRRPHEGLAQLNTALERTAGEVRLTGLVRVSRAACLMSVGDVDAAVEDVELAVGSLVGVDRGVALFQRASILARLGQVDRAALDFDDAIPLLQRGHAGIYEAHTRSNRGLMRAYSGDFAGARNDLERARWLYLRIGGQRDAAEALANLAFVANREGDVLRSLRLFEEARVEYEGLDIGVGMLDLDYCESLLAAGLNREAFERATIAAAALGAGGDVFQVPEAELIAAMACLQIDDRGEGRRWASSAEAAFTALDRTSWADHAQLVKLRCSDLDRGAISTVEALAARLDTGGLLNAALQAQLLAAELDLQSRKLERAATRVRNLLDQRPTADLRLGACDVGARIAIAESDTVQARAWLNRGARALERSQLGVASTEVRWSIAVHARGLLATGKRTAIARRRSPALFRWMELGRMTTIGRASLERPADPALSTLLDELRAVQQQLREPDDADSARRLTEPQRTLQSAISRRERVLRDDSGSDTAHVSTLAEVQRNLDGRHLVEFDVLDGRLVGVTATAHGSSMFEIADSGRVVASFGAATLALNRLSRPNQAERSSAAAAERLTAIANELDAILAKCWPGDRQLVIVPAPQLHAAPWTMLPSLHDRVVTVAPSASAWVTAGSKPAAPPRSVVLVAGAGLEQARSEVRAVATAHRDRVTLVGSRATAQRVMQAVDGAGLAHFATHHHHRRENPLFGSMELADGPLFLHDFLRANRLPTTVVLSACEGAQGEQGGADDVLGATTVMMERGTRSVIASPNRVSDADVTRRAMVLLHQRLAAGVSPSVALLDVRRASANEGPVAALLTASLECFGRG